MKTGIRNERIRMHPGTKMGQGFGGAHTLIHSAEPCIRRREAFLDPRIERKRERERERRGELK